MHDRALGRTRAPLQRTLGLPRQEDQQPGAGGVLQQVAGQHGPGGLKHGQVQRRDRLRCRRVRPHPGQIVGQHKEGRVALAALLAQQRHTQHGLVHVARHDLTEHQGLLPVIRVPVDRDAETHLLAGRGRVALQQTGLHPGPGERLVVVALRPDLQQLVQATKIAQRGQAIDPEGEEVARKRGLPLVNRRRRGVGQQQPAREIAHGRRAQRPRQPGQQPFHGAPLAASPQIRAEAAMGGIEGADRIRVEFRQPADLDALDLRRGVDGAGIRRLFRVRLQQQGRRQHQRLTRRIRRFAFLGPRRGRSGGSRPRPGESAQHEPGARVVSGETCHRESSFRPASWAAGYPR